MKLEFPIMIVSNEAGQSNAGSAALTELSESLSALDLEVVHVPSAHEATISSMTSRVSSVIVSDTNPQPLVDAIRERNENLPIFLFG